MILLWYTLLMFWCLAESQSCNTEGFVYNSCAEKCTCQGGRLTNCVRIRKEFTAMSFGERERYIRAVKQASTEFKEDYENLINIHATNFDSGIHLKDHFLPWHRLYILQYENLLRRIDCRVTAAYWDWSIDPDPWSTENPEDLWHSGDSGFGGNGAGRPWTPAQERCVPDGPFGEDEWSRVSPQGPKCLARNFNGNPPDDIAVEEVVLQDTFDMFEIGLRENLHNQVHCLIHGTMCTEESASAPEFFLHHGFIDKIWDDYQKRSPSHKNAFFPEVTQWMPVTDLYPSELIDLSCQPGGVRVEYQSSAKENRVMARLRGKTVKQLHNIQRKPFTPLLESALRLFHVSASDEKKARELEKLLEPRH